MKFETKWLDAVILVLLLASAALSYVAAYLALAAAGWAPLLAALPAILLIAALVFHFTVSSVRRRHYRRLERIEDELLARHREERQALSSRQTLEVEAFFRRQAEDGRSEEERLKDHDEFWFQLSAKQQELAQRQEKEKRKAFDRDE
jgi:hypothetical protein